MLNLIVLEHFEVIIMEATRPLSRILECVSCSLAVSGEREFNTSRARGRHFRLERKLDVVSSFFFLLVIVFLLPSG